VNVVEDTAADLRATSDALMRDLEVLAAIEEEKRTLEPGDPRLEELAQRVEEIARRVLTSTVRQRQLTNVGNEQVQAGAPGSATAESIERTPRPIAAILAEWRAVERRAASAAPDSADAAEAQALSEQYREEYRRALAERQDAR
jgi:DNA-binding HxlR family transcriptional regulator